MDFFDTVDNRKSVRHFSGREVEPAKIDRIVQAARMAPSAGGLQAFEIVVVWDRNTRARLGEAAHGQSFLADAPVLLAFIADEKRSQSKYGDRGASLFCIQDATIAAAYAQLAATALELSTCWVGAFDEGRVGQILGIHERLRAVALLPIGYAADL